MHGLTQRITAVLATLVLSVTTFAGAALASPAEESEFVSLINQSRASEGLAPLSVHGDLVSYARKHTAKMIAEGTIFHSTSSQLSSATTGWSLLGENVGMGPNPKLLHKAFMNSTSHRENILGPFDYVGVGADRDEDNNLFVTVIFMQVAESTESTESDDSDSTDTTTTTPTTTTTATAATATTTTPEPARSATASASPVPQPEPKPAVKSAVATHAMGFAAFFELFESRGYCLEVRAGGFLCIE